jgi:hypothetical protein
MSGLRCILEERQQIRALEGMGRKVAIPRGEIACPVAALRNWLEAAGIVEGLSSAEF